MMRKEIITSVDQIKAVSGISIEEAETHINYDRLNPFAYLYTTDNTMITKMKRIFNDSDDYICEAIIRDDDSIVAYNFIFPKTFITLRKGRKSISDEAKQNASKRFKQMWANKKQKEDEV